MLTLDNLLEKLWEDYQQINPQAGQIHALLEEKGETVINDHIAFRTFNLPLIGIDALAQNFIHLGYQPQGEYEFPQKKLKARHYEHAMSLYPKIFISELRVEEFSAQLQDTVTRLVDRIPVGLPEKEEFCVCGVPWPAVDKATYDALKAESEYAAWLAAFGFRANHFTVSVNDLTTFPDLQSLNAFLVESGFTLNTSGGAIKGTPKDFLEQSSTMAHPVDVEFSDGKVAIPGCYYEFARRYPLADGRLFSGFVAKSADKIFESTDNKRKK